MKKTYFRTGRRQAYAALLLALSASGTAAAHTVTYTYYRFHPTGLRNTGDPTIQLSELNLFNSAVSATTPLVPTTATDSVPENESGDGLAVNAIDTGTDRYDTKWLNFDYTTGLLTIGFNSPQAVDSYNYYTGNDEAGRDPVSWILEGSNDAAGPWTIVDVVNNTTPSSSRSALAFPTNFAIPDVPPAVITEFGYNDFTQSNIITNGSALLLYAEGAGQTLTLSSSAGGTPVTVTSGDIVSVTPPNSAYTTYTLTAHSPGGDATRSVSIRTVPGPTLTYRYIRYTPEKIVNGTTIALADISFKKSGVRVPVAAVENPGGTSAAPTPLTNLVDDPTVDFTTEYQSVLSPVIFDLGSAPVSYDSFTFTTGADASMAPLRWIMEGSNDKSTWTLVQNVNFDFNTPTAATAESPAIPFDGTAAGPFVSLTSNLLVTTSGAPVQLSYSILGATSATLMPGSVTLSGTGTYTVNPTSATTYTLSATSANGTSQASVTQAILPSATSLSFANFNDATLMRLVGDAKLVNDFANFPAAGSEQRLRMTEDANGKQSSAWYLAKMPVKGGFDTSYDAFIYSSFNPYGADGVGFVIQNASTGLTTNPGGQIHVSSNAVAVALDSWNDVAGEPGYANLEIWNGDTLAKVVDLSTTNPVLSHGGRFLANSTNPTTASPYHMRVVYTPPATTGANGAMTVYLDSTKVIDSFPISLETAGAVDADGKAYVGFMGRTGGFSEVHDIINWSLTTGSTATTTPLAITSSSFNTAGHTLTLNYSATAGQTYRVTTSPDLATWTQVTGTTNTVATSTSGTFSFSYPAATRGFFRIEQVIP